MKMCEQILKYNSNSLSCKKTKRRPIIAIDVRLLKKLLHPEVLIYKKEDTQRTT